MRISAAQLRQYCSALPTQPREVKLLFDDLGLEVKRMEIASSDVFLSIELLANRGDHYCYHGLAREVAARLGAPLVQPSVSEVEFGSPQYRPEILVESTLCPYYTLTGFEVMKTGISLPGKDAQEILLAAAAETGNAVVEASNLVNLELGQPLHAFDQERIEGLVVVRQARNGEKAWLLFTTEAQEIPEGTLVIADERKILAIAGVIGCVESRVTETTRTCLLESGVFDPVAVRRSARALRRQTAASVRFERGCDAAAVVPAIGRFTYVLETAGIARRTGPTAAIGQWVNPCRIIPLDLIACERFFQRNWTKVEVIDRLARYEFQHQGGLSFLVPPHRLWDVENQEDLFEELGRSVGWNSLPECLPIVQAGSVPSRTEDMQATVEQILFANGFDEIYTDGFYSRETRRALGIPEGHPLWEHSSTLNSVDKGYALLKNNCLVQALESIAANLRFRTNHVRLYEWTRTFHPDRSAENGVCTERHMLWGAAVGLERPHQWDGPSRPADLYFIKGLIEELRDAMGLPIEFSTIDTAPHPLAGLMHPYRSFSVISGLRTVGIAGELHPRVLRSFDIKNHRPIYFEIEQEALLPCPVIRPFVEPPEVPEIERMLSFSVPIQISVRDVEAALVRGGPPWLKQQEVADVFLQPNEGRSIAFRLKFDAVTPRTAEELNSACNRMIEVVTETFGAQGVKLR
jgi:phenylalanyl-tRNA synthetase beta chain